MKAIINATLVMRDHFIPDAVLFIEDGKILKFGEARRISIPDGIEIIDAEGLYVGPGFVDIHTHSDGKVFFQAKKPLPEGAMVKVNITELMDGDLFGEAVQNF
jgi:N-acetylglucosamine-6-phosphate deacetylase